MRLTLFAFATLGIAACSGGPGSVGSSSAVDGGPPGDGGGATDAALGDARGGDAADGCRTNADCNQSFEACFAPGQTVCGGAMPPEDCATDGDCADAGPGKVCLHHACGGSSCVDKCTSDADCKTTTGSRTICSLESGLCKPEPCTTSSCPRFFVCPADPNQGCVRKTCKADADCSEGACVNGQCWSGAGRCDSLPS